MLNLSHRRFKNNVNRYSLLQSRTLLNFYFCIPINMSQSQINSRPSRVQMSNIFMDVYAILKFNILHFNIMNELKKIYRNSCWAMFRLHFFFWIEFFNWTCIFDTIYTFGYCREQSNKAYLSIYLSIYSLIDIRYITG